MIIGAPPPGTSGCDNPGHQGLVHGPVLDNRDRQPDLEDRSHGEAEQRRGQGDPAMKMSDRFEVIFFDRRLPISRTIWCGAGRIGRSCAIVPHEVFHLPLDTGFLVPVDLPASSDRRCAVP